MDTSSYNMQHAVPDAYDRLHLNDEYKATQVQRELFAETSQWNSVELPLQGSSQPSIQDIAAAWHSLASHRECSSTNMDWNA